MMTPLHQASSFGYVKIVEYLIENGATIKDEDSALLIKCSICLHFSIHHMLEILRLLVKHGANVNVQNRTIYTK